VEDLDGIISVEQVIEDEDVVESIERGDTKVICLLGGTGVGKSSLANTLTCKKGAFKTSADLKSETDETKGVVTSMEHKGRIYQSMIIDTPGYGDTEGRDSIHTAKMILSLKSIKTVNAFIVCLNSSDTRIDVNKQGYLKLLSQMFGGEKFYKHVLICFTKWDFDKKGRMMRQIGVQLSEAKLI
jgi:predicted GTPase